MVLHPYICKGKWVKYNYDEDYEVLKNETLPEIAYIGGKCVFKL